MSHSHTSGCCQTNELQRRSFLKIALGAATLTASGLHFTPAQAGGTAEALLLSCMDYRLVDDIVTYMNGRGMVNQYDHVVLAGGSLGAVSDKLNWGKTFWDHLDVAIKLHHIKKVMVMDHLDCGAYRVVFEKDTKGDEEIALHKEQLAKLQTAIKAKYPDLGVELMIMRLDGSVMAV